MMNSLTQLIVLISIILGIVQSLPVENYRVPADEIGQTDGNGQPGSEVSGMSNNGTEARYESSYNAPNLGPVRLAGTQNDPFVSDNQFYDLVERDTQQLPDQDRIYAGDVIPTTEELQIYLQTFGYLPKDGDNFTPSEFEYGYVKLQHFTHIPVTGMYDYFTSRQMAYPRCGMVDLEDKETPEDDRRLPAFQSVFQAGRQSERQLSQTMTYNVLSYPQKPDRVRVEIAIAEALQMWKDASCTNFQRISDGESADIAFSWVPQTGGAQSVFGEPRPIAFTVKNRVFSESDQVPVTIYLDSNDDWTVEKNISVGMSIARVAAHSIGHVLGLPHSDVREAVMWPFYDDNVLEDFRLHRSDIDSLRAIYGSPCSRQYLPTTPQGPDIQTGFRTNIPTVVTRMTNFPTRITNQATNNIGTTNVATSTIGTSFPTTLRPPATSLSQKTPTSSVTVVTNRPTNPATTPTPPTPPPTPPPSPDISTSSPSPQFTTQTTATTTSTQPVVTNAPTSTVGNPPTTIVSPSSGTPPPNASVRVVCPTYPYYTFNLQVIPYPEYPDDLCRRVSQYNQPPIFGPPFFRSPFGPPFYGRPFRRKRSLRKS